MYRLVDLVGPKGYVHGWIKVGPGDPGADKAAPYHGSDGIRGDTGNGVVVGTYDHQNRTVTDRRGQAHRVIAVDPTAHDAGFNQDVESSHLSAANKQGMLAYDRAVASGARLGPALKKMSGVPTGWPSPMPSDNFAQYTAGRSGPSASFTNRYGRTLDMAAPKLGSGTRFKRLSATLAARGATNPDALAAWIGRRKYGAKGMGALSHSHSNASLLDILLADTAYDNSDDGTRDEIRGGSGGGRGNAGQMKCPNCGYKADSAQFSVSGGSSGTSAPSAPSTLETPSGGDTGTAGMNAGQVGFRQTGSVKGALSNTGQRSIRLSEPLPARLAVTGPYDYIVNRSAEDPSLVTVRHRRGGDTIGQIRKTDDGWQGMVGGNELEPRHQQRAALLELLSVHNRSVLSNNRGTSGSVLQPAPTQTPLMARYGIPAVRAFASPSNGASDGPRMTTSSGSDDSTGSNGLTPKGQAIYKKLIAKGFPAARALAFAKNSQNMSAGSFKKAS